jgi:hypothetical protein
METSEMSAGLILVTNNEDEWDVALADLPVRSKKIVERLIEFTGPNPSQREAHEILGISRETWRKIRGGAFVRRDSYEKAEARLKEREDELGMDAASTSDVEPADFVEFELTVDAIGLRIVGKGTTANMVEVRKQVADLYREIREKGDLA